MRDFLSAALPWVLAGVAVIILCAGGSRKKPTDGEAEDQEGQRIAVGMSLGLLLGILLDACGLWEDHSYGLALGPLWGMALAVLTDRMKKCGESDSNL